jgi:hypothetical protein
MGKKHVIRELKVVFDTNAFHTQVPSDLVNAATKALIEANSKHSDLTVTWHMPEVVVLERQYQMLQKADQLLRGFQKMDALLDFKISLTSEQLPPKIQGVIAAQMLDMKILQLKLDHGRVSWSDMIRNAALRIAPFQPGDTEKGFRDAVILETFMQLVESAPKSAKTCRLALITNDGPLTNAALARLEGHVNAEVLPGLEDLRNLINTLISSVDEAYVKEMREKARVLFFAKGDEDTLYFKENIGQRIEADFSAQLKELPPGAELSERGTTYVTAPRFIRKVGQRMHWLTSIEATLTAFKTQVSAPTPTETAILGTSEGLSGNTPYYVTPGIIGNSYRPQDYAATLTPQHYISLGLGSPTREKIQVKKGHADFNVDWSATVTKNRKLSHPQIDNISFVATTWE